MITWIILYQDEHSCLIWCFAKHTIQNMYFAKRMPFLIRSSLIWDLCIVFLIRPERHREVKNSTTQILCWKACMQTPEMNDTNVRGSCFLSRRFGQHSERSTVPNDFRKQCHKSYRWSANFRNFLLKRISVPALAKGWMNQWKAILKGRLCRIVTNNKYLLVLPRRKESKFLRIFVEWRGKLEIRATVNQKEKFKTKFPSENITFIQRVNMFWIL